MRVGVVTLFPEMFSALTDYGVTGRAVQTGLMRLSLHNPRDFAEDRHRTVDDKPFGGGPGMLMKTGPLATAIAATRAAVGKEYLAQAGIDTDAEFGQKELRQQEVGPANPLKDKPDGEKEGSKEGNKEGNKRVPTIYLSPQGRRLTQDVIADMAAWPALVVVCGRYQGIDARLLEAEIDAEWSLGDYVISGGELAAMVLLDALIRLQAGALGDDDSARLDSFSNGLLHCPQYTRPRSYAGIEVPEVLLGGDHQRIARWQRQQSLGMTWLKRPELLQEAVLSDEDRELLNEFKRDHQP